MVELPIFFRSSWDNNAFNPTSCESFLRKGELEDFVHQSTKSCIETLPLFSVSISWKALSKSFVDILNPIMVATSFNSFSSKNPFSLLSIALKTSWNFLINTGFKFTYEYYKEVNQYNRGNPPTHEHLDILRWQNITNKHASFLKREEYADLKI